VTTLKYFIMLAVTL